MTQTDGPTRRGRLALLLLLAIFLVPAAIAWTLFFGGWRPATTGNHGDLLEPPVRLEAPDLAALYGPDDALSFRGHWTMLMVSGGECGDACQTLLQETRQIRRALAQNADRAQRVLVLPEADAAPSEAFLARHRDLHVVVGEMGWADHAGLNASTALRLVDTRGYLMMEYPEPVEPAGVLEDMKHLLRLSNIDIERLDGLSDRD